MTIRTKLLAMLSFFTLAIFCVVGLNYFTYLKLDSDSSIINNAGKLRANGYRMAYLAERIHQEGSTGDMAAMLKDRMDFYDTLLSGLLNGSSDLQLEPITAGPLKDELQAIADQWNTTMKPAYEKVLSDNDPEAAAVIEANIDGFIKQVDTLVGNYSEFSHAKVTTAKAVSVGIAAIAVALALGALIILQKAVIRPIQEISAELYDISTGQGDLTHTLEVKGRDEISELTGHFNTFVDSIRNIIVQVSASSRTLSSNMDAISDTSSEMVKSTEMIANAVQDVSAGSVEQSDKIRAMTDMVTDMTDKLRAVGLVAQTLLTQAESSRSAALDGNSILDEQTENLRNVVSETRKTADTVNLLQTYTQDIQGILDIIAGISTQTNLLALNAAIEAARAGEAGRGFAVVADEIRKLAEETTRSTREIGEIVGNITGQTQTVKSSMDGVVDHIETQAKSMISVKNQLDDIVHKSEGTFKGSEEIQQVTNRILEDFSIINQSANAISGVVEKNAANTQDVAAAVEEQTASFQEIAANLDALSTLAQDMKVLVERFKIS